jgi:DNA repair photolyase
MMMKKFEKIKSYEDWRNPKIISNAIEVAKKQLPKLVGKADYIHISFATDPFMYHQPEVIALTLQLMELINFYGIPVHTLTKGVIPPEALGISKQNVFEISLVSISEQFRARFEPGAAPYGERIASLRLAHENGLRTWVNMEPYPTPNIIKQDLIEILEQIDFVDNIRLSKWNYNDKVEDYPNWREFYHNSGVIAKKWCKEHNIYYEGLAAVEVPSEQYPNSYKNETLF